MNVMNEVALTGNTSTLSFNYNFDEINNNLDIVEGLVAQIDPATSDYEDVLDMEKKLKKLSSSIAKAGTEAMAPAKAVIKEFEANLRAAKDRIAKIQDPLTRKHNEMDQVRRDAKKAKAEAAIQDTVIKFGLTPKYASQLAIKPEYLNLSGTDKSVREDIENEAVTLKAKQNEEARILAEAMAVIDTVNQGIVQKLSIDDFQSLIDFALRQPTPDNGWVAAQIREKAAEVKAAEEEIAKKAAAEATAKAKAEAAMEIERAKKDAASIPAPASIGSGPQRLTLPTQIPDDDDDEMDSSTPSNTPTVAPKPMDINTPEVSIWEMVIQLRGNTENLKVVGEELKRICEANHVAYVVDRQKSHKIA